MSVILHARLDRTRSVRVGEFQTRADAIKAIAKYKKDGLVFDEGETTIFMDAANVYAFAVSPKEEE